MIPIFEKQKLWETATNHSSLKISSILIRYWAIIQSSQKNPCEIAAAQTILVQTPVPQLLALFSGHGQRNQILFFAKPPPSVGASENVCLLKFEYVYRANMCDNQQI